jgi:hypothetical protein
MQHSRSFWLKGCLTAVFLWCWLPAPARADYLLTGYSPSVYTGKNSDLNAAVGIKGYEIENFNKTKLVPNLSYTVGGQTFTALPQTFSTSQKVFGFTPWKDAGWGGQHILVPNTGNDIYSRWHAITINILGGTSSFGVGISGVLGGSTSVFVNGVLVGKLTDLAEFQKGMGRNVYLKIDAAPGDESITSVTIGSDDPLDVRSFSHVAIRQHMPEPSTLALGGLGVACLLGYGWRRRARRPAVVA